MSLDGIETVVADTALAHRVHYRLRYQVFCLDTGFEDAARHPDFEEKDEFDEHSVHFLARLRHSGDWVAAARLVLPADDVLPVENFCSISPKDIARVHNLPYRRTAEFSRLLIASSCARRRHQLPNHRFRSRLPTAPTHTKPAILTDLILAMAAYCLDHDVPQWVFLVAPALGRILRRMGIELTEIGDPCEHRGLRFPYITRVEQINDALSALNGVAGDSHDHRYPYRLFSELQTLEDLEESDDRLVGQFGA